LFADSGVAGELGNNLFLNSSSQYIYLRADPASRYKQYQGVHSWLVSTNTPVIGDPIVFSTAMTLDASGNLVIGDTTAGARLHVSKAGAGTIEVAWINNAQAVGADVGSRLVFTGTTNNNGLAAVSGAFEGATTADGGYMTLATRAVTSGTLTERARITSGGGFLVGRQAAIGSELLCVEGSNADFLSRIRNTSATTPSGLFVSYTAAAPNGTGSLFLRCDDSAATRAEIRSNGGLANYQSNNVDLSDARTKTDINPLGSYWSKIAGLEIVTYKYKDQTHDDLNIGVIAQQVEAVAPEFVDSDGFGETPEDGVPLKTIYNKDLTFAAIKALQEAMARIETLEAKIAVLESKGV
jgi:hypothetical protein